MKNPFATDDNAGVLGMLVGLIVVVFVALGLSLLVTKEVSLPGSANNQLRAANDHLRAQINRLEIRIDAQKRLNEKAAKHREQVKLVDDLEKQIASANEEISILNKLIVSKESAIKLLSEGKETHRLKYREHVRAEAHGETCDVITTRLGKKYEDVRITKVSPLGISISHRHGAARLGYNEMPEEWRKRLMYSAVEMAQAKLAEEKRQIAARKAIAKRVQKIRKVEKNASIERKIVNLRRQIASVSMKLSTARVEARLARNKVSYQRSLRLSRSYSRPSYRYYNTRTGTYYRTYYRPRYRITLNGSKSVPGSLETWEQRAARYERASSRYAAQLQNLRSELIALDPSYGYSLERQKQR